MSIYSKSYPLNCKDVQHVKIYKKVLQLKMSDNCVKSYYTPRSEVVGGILVSPCPSICPPVDKSYVVR